MVPRLSLSIFLLFLLFYSCQNNSAKYSHTIKDFRKELRPHLARIVDKGIVMFKDSALRHMATDEELVRLGKSEHPILRAAAFREMLERRSFNHFDIILEHLDDTALVFTHGGEFGIWDRTVSDDILQEANWKTMDERNRMVEHVLTKHNYLSSAYFILDRIEPQQKYYSFIKDMAVRPRRLDPDDGSELAFADIEYALYGLSRFGKKEDVEVIKQKLLKHVWRLSDLSFRLMKEFPDSAYMDVLQTYHRRQFYKFSGNRPNGFTGVGADRAAPEDFIEALVAQQNDRSARLLDTMLTRIPQMTCMPDKKRIQDELITSIWAQPCPAYKNLRQRIRPRAEKILKGHKPLFLEKETIDKSVLDSSETFIRWFD